MAKYYMTLQQWCQEHPNISFLAMAGIGVGGVIIIDSWMR